MSQSEIEQELLELCQKNQELATQLIGKQIVSPKQLDRILGREYFQLGQLLLQEKLILKYELDQALKEHRRSQKKLGEILIEKCMISQTQLERLLRKQG